ncbi:MAG: HPr family phosphocarrier protein [Anaerolineales bacterium]|nr:HPr family phosphocarrier protein [Anaerolineales bacterium]MCX7753687.1 HPr family phosphocarrier protein [Anaerolineales bacterium]MDW8276455.1 HPr family phosphocarrier protein [Anaerolineales bacterium]
MPELTLTIQNKVGLHARPASLFVREASRFQSTITVLHGAKQANAKSILNVLSLGVNQGAQITLRAEGPDAEAALHSLRALVESNFGETE